MEDKVLYLTGYSGVTQKIQRTIGQVADSFCYIGYLLYHCKKSEWFKELNYGSVIEYAEKELGFKKSTTYNFINVCERFSEYKSGMPSDYIDQKYKCFTFQKLVQMTSIKNLDMLEEINSDMTVKEIKEKKISIRVEKQVINNIEVLESKIDIIIPDPVVPIEKNVIDVDFKSDSIIDPILKNDISDYLNRRLELLRSLAKNEKQSKSNDYFLYLGGFNEIKFLIDELEKDFIKSENF